MVHRTIPDQPEAPVAIALARDEQTAERWSSALAAHGIEAEVRIEDGTYLAPGGSAFTGQTFVYRLWVAARDRRAAATVLVDLGPRGPFPPRSARLPSVRSALVVVAAALALAVILVIRGG